MNRNSGFTNRNTSGRRTEDRRSKIKLSRSESKIPSSLKSSTPSIVIPRSAEELFKAATALLTKLRTDSCDGLEERCISLFLEAAEEAIKCAVPSSQNEMEQKEVTSRCGSSALPVNSNSVSPTLEQLYSFVTEAYGNVLELLLTSTSHYSVSDAKEKHHMTYKIRRALVIAARELSLYPFSVTSLVRYGWVQIVAIYNGLVDGATVPAEQHDIPIHPYTHINNRLSLEENALECFRAVIQLIDNERNVPETCQMDAKESEPMQYFGATEQCDEGNVAINNDTDVSGVTVQESAARSSPPVGDQHEGKRNDVNGDVELTSPDHSLCDVYLQATIAFAICGCLDEGIEALQTCINAENIQSPLLIALLAWLHTASSGGQEGKVDVTYLRDANGEYNVGYESLDDVSEDMEIPLQILDACLAQFPDFLFAHLLQIAVLLKGTSVTVFRREGLIARLRAVTGRIRAVSELVTTGSEYECHPYTRKYLIAHGHYNNLHVYGPLYCLLSAHVGICAARNIMSECIGDIDKGSPSSAIKDALLLAESISDFAITHNDIKAATPFNIGSLILSRLCSVKAEILMLKYEVLRIELRLRDTSPPKPSYQTTHIINSVLSPKVKDDSEIEIIDDKSCLDQCRELCNEALIHDLRNEHALEILGTLLLFSDGISTFAPSAGGVRQDILQKAHQLFSQAQEITPRSSAVLQKLALCRSLVGDKEEAAELLMTACSVRNTEPVFPLTWMMWFV